MKTKENLRNISDDEINSKIKLDNIQKELQKSFDELQDDIYNTSEINDLNTESISYNDATERMKITKNTADVFLKNAKSDRFWKSVYAFILLVILGGQIIWLNIIFFKVGKGQLQYGESTFNIYISASLIEVIAIVKLVVKHLFHDNLSTSFKNALDNIKPKDNK